MSERALSSDHGTPPPEGAVSSATAAATPLQQWLAGPRPEGVEHVLSRLRATPGVARIAVMPDVHVASEFCVGTVVASEEWLFPNAVGGDIGCGMLALRFDGSAEVLADAQRAARVLGAFYEVCPGRRHHRKLAHALPGHVAEMGLSHPHLEAQLHGEPSRVQLGTLGAGNHFLELQRDVADDSLWLMLHTGSRHLGQNVLHHHLPKARRLESGIFALPADSAEGRAYLADVAVARAWAKENRRRLAMAAARAVEGILGVVPRMETLVDCDHNHVQREMVDGREMLVHRKGATAAHAGVAGIVPGSMGTRSFHTVGRGVAAALNSSSHGAGRALSRSQARATISRGTLRRQLRGVYYDARLEGQLLEEAPGAYKDVVAVMRAQEELTRVVRELRPVLVYKGD